MSEDFTIEENVAKPKKATGRGPKYPFSKMKVGQSFAVYNAEDTEKVLNRLRAAVQNYRNRNSKSYRFRVALDNDGNPRVWREPDKEPKK